MDALDCILTRRSHGRLTEPAPSDADLGRLLAAAAAAPDHGLLRPWRFIVLRGHALLRLGEVFAKAEEARGADAGTLVPEEVLARTRAKPLRAPLIVALIASPKESPKVPAWEQLASAAAAAQNLCLAAHALGYGSMWRTGWYGDAPEVRAHLELASSERVMAWIYLGTRRGDAALPPRPLADLAALTAILDD
jgi:nitroreductase